MSRDTQITEPVSSAVALNQEVSQMVATNNQPAAVGQACNLSTINRLGCWQIHLAVSPGRHLEHSHVHSQDRAK